jgi:hypothetical protein
VGRGGLEAPTSALSRRELHSGEFATLNDVARRFQSSRYDACASCVVNGGRMARAAFRIKIARTGTVDLFRGPVR